MKEHCYCFLDVFRDFFSNIYSVSFVAYKGFFLLDSILIFVGQHHFCWTASSFLLDSILTFVGQHPHLCWTTSSFLLNNFVIFVVQHSHFYWTASLLLLNNIPIFVEQHRHFCWTTSSFLSATNMFVYSANNTSITSWMFKGRLFIYKFNKGGPRIEPWGTPCTALLSQEVYVCCVKFLLSSLVISTNCEKLYKWDLHHNFVSSDTISV